MTQLMPKRILYTSPRGIGDLIFSLPLLYSLKTAYPQAEIFIPLPEDKQEMLRLTGIAQPTKRYLPKPKDHPLANLRWKASQEGNTAEKYRLEKLIYEEYLRGEHYDVAILPKDFTLDSLDCQQQITERDLDKAGILAESPTWLTDSYDSPNI